jgi:hypothetical protein
MKEVTNEELKEMILDDLKFATFHWPERNDLYYIVFAIRENLKRRRRGEAGDIKGRVKRILNDLAKEGKVTTNDTGYILKRRKGEPFYESE